MATLFRAGSASAPIAPARAARTPDDRATSRWGASSETGRLADVLLSKPAYLSMVPCNEVTREGLSKGLFASPVIAARQHRALVAALEAAGVRCHFVRPVPGLADLTFMRDAVLVSPWGLIELRPAAAHRRTEPSHVAVAAGALGIPHLGRIEQGNIEGGDICLLREGVLLIGISGERTDETGARALGAMFERRGWEVLHTRYDPKFLHLDTLFTMLSGDRAVACPEALDAGFLARIARLGVGIVPASLEEVGRLAANLLSLGDRRLLAPAGNDRLNLVLRRQEFDVVEVELDQFTRCGGGLHCLTMPLARRRDGPAQ